VYSEDLAHGARTAIFGSATVGLAEELALRGARVVHVYDVDAARVAEATARSHDRSIFYALLPEGGDIGVRDGAFDFVLVPDLSLFADPVSIVALVRRVVSPLGAALIASPNSDAKAPLLPIRDPRQALGYYELYETIAAQFQSVRMIGQAPFVGYAVAELSVEDPEPTIDSSLAESEGKEPDWFLALASDRNLRLDPFALIELPIQHFAAAARGASADDVVASAAPESGTSAAGSGTVLINILEAEREAALESLRQQEQAIDVERFRADRAVQELVAAREEVELLRERCRAMGERAGEEEARRSALESRLEQARHDPELAALRERLRASQERQDPELAALRERLRASQERHDAELAALRERLRTSEERQDPELAVLRERLRASEERQDPELAALRERLHASEERVRALDAAARVVAAEHEGEVAKLETLLRDRGREIQELRAEIDRREKLVRELVMTNFSTGPVETPPAPSSELQNGSAEVANGSKPLETPPGIDPSLVADLSARLGRLASDAARREADLVGARWRIAQLERELMQQR
jgi:SAM-dependent methyltransferase